VPCVERNRRLRRGASCAPRDLDPVEARKAKVDEGDARALGRDLRKPVLTVRRAPDNLDSVLFEHSGDRVQNSGMIVHDDTGDRSQGLRL
jgi:hypothetical protein